MELRHFRYFIAVAEQENVSRAALKLHVSQPGVSRQIRDLEYEIGFLLFERRAKRVRLTRAGKIFLKEAREVLKRADDAVAKARLGIEATSEIHVGYAPSLTVQILPSILQRFEQAFPHVRVRLHDLSSEEMLERLRAKKLSVALTIRPPANKLRDLSSVEIIRYRMVLLVAPGHPLARFKFVTLKQIASEPLISLNRKQYPDKYVLVKKLFAAIGVKPKIAEEHEGGSGAIAAIESGRGIGLGPSSIESIVGSRLKLIPFKPELPPVCVEALWLKSNPTEIVEKLVAVMKH